MSDQQRSGDSKRQQFIADLLSRLSDPIHKRLVEAYKGESPLETMEAELSAILMEITGDED